MILARMAQTTLINREQIDTRVAEMAREIEAEFAGSELIALCVLKGAMFFCADLVRQMKMDVALDFIQISSYGNQKYSSGVVTILKEPQLDMRGKSVLIVESICSNLCAAASSEHSTSRNGAAVFSSTPGQVPLIILASVRICSYAGSRSRSYASAVPRKWRIAPDAN